MTHKPWATLDEIATNMFREGSWPADTGNFTYSFPTTRPIGYSALTGNGKTFSTFSLEQRSWAEEAMNLWSDIVDIEFINLGSGADGELRLMNTETHNGGAAHAYGPGTPVWGGDVWIHSDKASNFDLNYGTHAFGTLVHEIGHALGLEHPGNYDVSEGPSNYQDDAAYFQDSIQYTIMSYFDAEETGGAYYGVDAQTPMLHDIWAMQARYGANTETRTGNTVYGFGSTADRGVYDFSINPYPVLTIWDAGGSDTLSLSQSNYAVRLDLRPGKYSDALGLKYNIAIAYGTWIENAKGGRAGDTVIGNEVTNSLHGLGGYDKLYGKEGADSLYGGDEGDDLFGGDGGDKAWGGDDDDRAFGEAGNDELHGDGGRDSLYGSDGADILWGDAGDDFLSGNVGLDTFFGGSGRDTVSFIYSDANWSIELGSLNGAPHAEAYGSQELLHSIEGVEMGDGHDTVHGSAEANALAGGGGNDRLYGYGGNDTLSGGEGNDRLYRSSGNNDMTGGAGIDTVDYGGTPLAIRVDLQNQFSGQIVVDQPGFQDDQIDKLKQIEVLMATAHDDTVMGAYAVDNTIEGRGGDDELWGGGGSNNLMGGLGNDKLFSGAGDDILRGGFGSDTASYEHGTAGVIVSLAGGSQAIAGFGSDRLIRIENLTGTDFSDGLYGNAFSNALRGLSGSDHLVGQGGSDTLTGDTGDDNLEGGSGNDSLDGGEGKDVFTPGAGNDFVGGWIGSDTVNYSDAEDAVNVDLAVTSEQFISAHQGSDRILDVESAVGSSAFNDTLKGTNGSNKLYGLGGNDLIEARSGNDVIDGGMGYDTASFESSAVGVNVSLGSGLPQNTGAGIDSFVSIEAARGSAFNDILLGDVVGNRLYGLAGNDWLAGGEGHDWLDGGQSDDLLIGGAGNDTLVGNSGNDTVSYAFATAGVTVSLTSSGQTTGGAGDDHILSVENLDGSLFADTLDGSIIANHLNGFDGNDRLQGFGGDDTLNGGAANDTLTGGAGKDLLSGGLGADQFTFLSVADSPSGPNRDVIADFEVGVDHINLAAIDANANAAGKQNFTLAPGGAFTGVAGQVIVQAGATTFVYADTDGNAVQDMTIELTGNKVLTAGDFIFA